MGYRLIEGAEARALSPKDKWDMLSPYLLRNGADCMSYSSLQEGMEYFIDDGVGYIAFSTLRHPLLSRNGRRFILGDPIAPASEYGRILADFLSDGRDAIFYQISREFAEVLSRERSLKVNEMGVEWDIDLASFSTKGKDKAQLRHWINKAQKENVEVSECQMADAPIDTLRTLSDEWLKRKGGEAKFITRPVVFENEPGVRLFLARREGRIIGMTIFDPLHRDGKLFGYYHNMSRVEADAPHGTTDLMNVRAMELFKSEGVPLVSLGMSPFCELEDKDFKSSRAVRALFRFMYEHCGHIYPAKGNYFHKSRYGGSSRKIYLASTRKDILSDLLLAVNGLGMSIFPG
jgi:lysylphosphatidylglycerol synthetase-like protein (DUF2156 family)